MTTAIYLMIFVAGMFAGIRLAAYVCEHNRCRRCIPPVSGLRIGPWRQMRLIGEVKEHGMDKLKYNVVLPTVSGGDIKTLELLISETLADGTPQPTQTINLDPAASTADFSVQQDSTVILSLHAVDDSGNDATSDPFTFTAKDTIPPQITGGFTLNGPIEETNEPG